MGVGVRLGGREQGTGKVWPAQGHKQTGRWATELADRWMDEWMNIIL